MKRNGRESAIAVLGVAAALVAWAAPCAAALGVSEIRSGAAMSRPVVSVLATPTPRSGDHWSAADAPLDLPSGDPLTEPLRFSDAEERIFAAAANDRLEKVSLVDAALVACGVESPAALERYHARFAALRDELLLHPLPLGEGRGEGDTLEKIHAIHRVLHAQLLRRYDASATDLGGTFDTGDYNCASATLLFVALAGEIGLTARGVELPGHVRAIVDGDDGRCEVEVTCPAWGQAVRRTGVPGDVRNPFAENQPELASVRLSGLAHEEPGASARRLMEFAFPAMAGDSHRYIEQKSREVTPAGLVAMVYYNRGVDAFNDRRFADAVEANRKALVLDPDNRTARGNLLASVNNWALALCDAKHYSEAQSLLASGRRFDPTHEAFVTNAAHVERVQRQSRFTN